MVGELQGELRRITNLKNPDCASVGERISRNIFSPKRYQLCVQSLLLGGENCFSRICYLEASCSLRVWKVSFVHASAECSRGIQMPGNPQVPLCLFNYHLLIAFLPAVDMLGRS